MEQQLKRRRMSAKTLFVLLIANAQKGSAAVLMDMLLLVSIAFRGEVVRRTARDKACALTQASAPVISVGLG